MGPMGTHVDAAMEDHFGMAILLDATLGANHDPPESSLIPIPIPIPNASGVHQCRICKRSYERADHLNRHLKSHENARPFRCSRCPKRFNRADLLGRHLATHDRHSSRDPDRPLIKRTDRAAEACLACAASKSKCEDQKPCRRCRTKQIPCETSTSSSAGQARAANRDKSPVPNGRQRESASTEASQRNDLDQLTSTYHSSSTALGGSPVIYHTGGTPFSPSGQGLQEPMIARGGDIHNGAIANHEGPSTALYGSGGMEGMSFNDMNDTLFLPNVSEFNQDLDFGFWDFNFEGVQLQTTNSPPNMMVTQHSTPSNQVTASKVARDLSRGYAAFKRSPWLWTPAQKDHQLSDSENLALDEVSITSGLTPSSTTFLSIDSLTQSPHLDASLRDGMFALVLKMTMNKSARPVPTFPPLDILNHILHIFFVRQRYQVDHWIHAPTFSAKKSCPHLIIALISAGSTFISVPAIWKMGLALQEVVRLAVGELVSDSLVGWKSMLTIAVGIKQQGHS
jgi:hypothetical protein